MPFDLAERNMETCRRVVNAIDNHSIFVTYPTVNDFISRQNDLAQLASSEAILISKYNGIKYYRDWLIENIAGKIDAGAVQKGNNDLEYTTNITNALGNHPKPVDEGNPVVGAAINLLVAEIKQKAANIEAENRADALARFQDYVIAEMNRAYAGDYASGQEEATMEEMYNIDAPAALGAFADQYDTASFLNAMKEKFGEDAKAIDGLHKRQMRELLSDGITKTPFWQGFPSDYDLLAGDGLSDKKKVEQVLLKGKADPIEFALNKIRTNPVGYGIEMETGEKTVQLEGVNNDIANKGIILPEDVIRISFHNIEGDIRDSLQAFIDIIVANSADVQDLLNAPNYQTLKNGLDDFAPEMQTFIWITWSQKNYELLINNIKGIKLPPKNNYTYDNTGHVIINLVDEVHKLGLHPSVHDEAAMKYLLDHGVRTLPTQDDTDVINIAKFVVTERYADFCAAKNIEGKAVAIAKTSALLATVNSIVRAVKGSEGKLNDALNAEPNNAEEALDAAKDGFIELFSIGDVLADFALTVTGLNIASAVATIPGFVNEAKKAMDLRQEAKTEMNKWTEELEKLNTAMENDANVHAVNLQNKVDYESKIFALGVVLTKKLRQFIWDIVEILKRVLAICSTILKITGVGAVVGFSLDLIKTTINAIQQSYFLGRAIYKKRKGTKGLDRRAAADQFVKDCFVGGERYAAEIIVKTGANSKVSNENMKAITDPDAFLLQITEMSHNSPQELAACKSVILTDLFKALSSKPTATLSRLLFPGSGFIKSFA